MKNFITKTPTKDETIIRLEAREHEIWTELRAVKGGGNKANLKRRGLKGKLSACQQLQSLHYDSLKRKQGLTPKSIY